MSKNERQQPRDVSPWHEVIQRSGCANEPVSPSSATDSHRLLFAGGRGLTGAVAPNLLSSGLLIGTLRCVARPIMIWFYADAGQQKGPFPDEEFQRLVRLGIVRPETLVWHAELPEWKAWKVVAESMGRPVSDAAPVDAGPMFAPPVVGDATSSSSNAGAAVGSTESGAAASAGPAAGLPQPGPGQVVCAECGKVCDAAETLSFGERIVCSTCKPLLLQRLHEGAPMPTAGTGYISMEQLLAEDYAIDIGDFFQKGLEAFKRQPLILIATLVLGYAILVAVSMLGIIPGVGGILGPVVQMALFGPLFGGVYKVCLGVVRNQPADISELFHGFGSRFFQLVIATAIPQAVTLLAMVPLMILGGTTTVQFAPGQPPPAAFNSPWWPAAVAWMVLCWLVMMYLTVAWVWALPLVVDKGMQGLSALRLSMKMVHKHWWLTLLLVICWGLIGGSGVIACCVGALATLPIAFCGMMTGYDRIFGRLEPASSTR